MSNQLGRILKCGSTVKQYYARLRGIEPLASSVTGTRSNQLSYSPTLLTKVILLQNYQK